MLGVMAGTAVLIGAFIVGDSVRYSLRKLTLERLGSIDQVLLADHFFSPQLVERLDMSDQSLDGFSQAVPVVLLSPTTIENTARNATRRSGQVTLLGAGPAFWELTDAGPRPRRLPSDRQIVLNRSLADDLQARVGDHVVVRLPKADRIAADSPLGEKSDRVTSLAELEVIEILPAEGLARFSLHASQALPRTAFLDTAALQQALDQPDRVNALLIGGRNAEQAASADQVTALRRQIRPTLEDAGLKLKMVSLAYSPPGSDQAASAFRYLSLSSDTMMFSPPMEKAVREALAGREFQTVLTYLANSISQAEPAKSDAPQIPYSTVSALDPASPLSPLGGDDGELAEALGDDQIVLNQWAAKDLGVEPGDRIQLTYFAPETAHGEVREESRNFTLAAIAPLVEPVSPYGRRQPARYEKPPSRANDPDLTPEVPGITDQESIDDWDPPFPFDYRRIRDPQDEEYWDNYRTTPKAFVSQRAGESMWGSRFGTITSFRIADGDAASLGDIQQRLTAAIANDLTAFGFNLLPVKEDGLRASKGTTPFNALFLGFSFFIIAAALMLVSLLFRLSLERRADEAGLLLALGLEQKQVTRLFLHEGLMITLCGVLLGALLGVGYASLMIFGLRTWWLDAVVTPFLELHVTSKSLLLGALVGAITSMLTVWLTAAALRTISLRDLLAKNIEPVRTTARRGRLRSVYLIGTLWVLAVMSGVAAVFLRGESQAGAFFAAGASVLMALMLQVSRWLSRPLAVADFRRRGFSMQQMIVRNLGRNSGRSTLTLGLMAMACFLIVAISAFRLRPTDEGTGGFQWLGRTDVPVFADLNDPQAREDLLASQASVLRGSSVFAWRVQPGDDASCRNLYQAQRPQLLGVTADFVRHFDGDDPIRFQFADSAAKSAEDRANPWRLLTESQQATIPVVLDKNTAMYSLHLYRGIGEEFELDYGSSGTLRFRVVGLLANSILQGSLLMSETELVERFPDVSGYRYFLIRTPASQQQAVQLLLEEALSDQGFEARDTRELLADLLAVQNTYLSTFQSLGGLGLLLGTFGLLAVQLRNVFERRGELALLRATGFSQQRLGRLVLGEHLVLLLGGLGIGLVAALVAVLPHAWTTDVRPPWFTLLWVLATILAMGMVTGYLALRPVVRAPLMDALRGE
jgi:ABC-type antimicrobial peptide transport system permease subunit